MEPIKPDYSREFESLLSSPLGKELISELELKHDSLIRDAQSENTIENAFGLLKEASGVKLAIGHIQFLSVLPKSEGSQEK